MGCPHRIQTTFSESEKDLERLTMTESLSYRTVGLVPNRDAVA